MKTIKELHNDDKPREKLVKKGVKALKNDELLSVLIGSGIKGKDVRKLSREVFADAIADRAAGIIIAHNHPSGTLSASRADIAITQRLDEVSKLVGIELLDHVILAKDGFYSFSDEGLL